MSRTNQSIVETTEREDSFYLFFILLASPKKKRNKQTERTLAGTPQELWPITAGPDTSERKKIKKTRNIKKHS